MEPMVVHDTTHVFSPVERFDEVDESRLDQGYIYETVLNQASVTSGLKAAYHGGFHLNGAIQNLDYSRYENPYVVNGSTARKAGSIHFAFAGKTLSLDYGNNLRTLGD